MKIVNTNQTMFFFITIQFNKIYKIWISLN